MTEETPSQKLSVAVTEKLIESGLIRPEKRDSISAQLGSGKLKSEDWKLEIDLASETELQK